MRRGRRVRVDCRQGPRRAQRCGLGLRAPRPTRRAPAPRSMPAQPGPEAATGRVGGRDPSGCRVEASVLGAACAGPQPQARCGQEAAGCAARSVAATGPTAARPQQQPGPGWRRRTAPGQSARERTGGTTRNGVRARHTSGPGSRGEVVIVRSSPSTWPRRNVDAQHHGDGTHIARRGHHGVGGRRRRRRGSRNPRRACAASPPASVARRRPAARSAVRGRCRARSLDVPPRCALRDERLGAARRAHVRCSARCRGVQACSLRVTKWCRATW